MAQKKSPEVTEKTVVFDPSDDRSVVADQAIADPAILAALVEALSDPSRRVRQFSASALGAVALTQPELLKPFADELGDALHRPEAQTRWEVLDILHALVPVDARTMDKALDGLETALHDENSGIVRLAAFRALASYGATTEHRADRVWPLIDEAIQCYHGDPEFNSMLESLLEFVEGKASKEVRKGVAERMAFDAQETRNPMHVKAQEIVDAARRK